MASQTKKPTNQIIIADDDGKQIDQLITRVTDDSLPDEIADNFISVSPAIFGHLCRLDYHLVREGGNGLFTDRTKPVYLVSSIQESKEGLTVHKDYFMSQLRPPIVERPIICTACDKDSKKVSLLAYLAKYEPQSREDCANGKEKSFFSCMFEFHPEAVNDDQGYVTISEKLRIFEAMKLNGAKSKENSKQEV